MAEFQPSRGIAFLPIPPKQLKILFKDNRQIIGTIFGLLTDLSLNVLHPSHSIADCSQSSLRSKRVISIKVSTEETSLRHHHHHTSSTTTIITIQTSPLNPVHNIRLHGPFPRQWLSINWWNYVALRNVSLVTLLFHSKFQIKTT